MVGFRLGGGTLVSGAAARLDSPPTDPPRSPEGEAPGSPGHPFGSPFFCSDNECAICLGSLRGPTPFPSEECPHVYCADCLEKLQAHQPRAAMLCPQVFLRTQNDGFTLKLLDLILTTTLCSPHSAAGRGQTGCGRLRRYWVKNVDFVLKCLNFVPRIFDFVLKMLNFAAPRLPPPPPSLLKKVLVPTLGNIHVMESINLQRLLWQFDDMYTYCTEQVFGSSFLLFCGGANPFHLTCAIFDLCVAHVCDLWRRTVVM